MNTDQEQTKTVFRGLHSELCDRVIRTFYDVYNELGGGFLEGVYQKAFALALHQAGLEVESEVAVPVVFRGVVVGDYRADLTVNDCVLIELKAVSGLDQAHEGQVLHYLRATTFEVGLLFNFGTKPQFKRFVLDNGQKKIRANPR